MAANATPACPAGLFVTATDTGAGKTCVAAGLMAALQAHGLSSAGMKPVASGARRVDGQLRNDDALILQRQSSVALPYEAVNPYVFAPPIAPHLAAAEVGVSMTTQPVCEAYHGMARQVDVVVVEGVGGWMVPLNAQATMADLAIALGLPVVLVVALRLGCLNHALLTQTAIRAHGLTLAGWVANAAEGLPERAEANIETLRARLAAPFLGTIPRLADPNPPLTAEHLLLDGLIRHPGRA